MDDQCPERDRCHGCSPVPVPEGGHREPINPLHLVAATLGGPRAEIAAASAQCRSIREEGPEPKPVVGVACGCILWMRASCFHPAVHLRTLAAIPRLSHRFESGSQVGASQGYSVHKDQLAHCARVTLNVERGQAHAPGMS
jgi:hypothetical protein